MKLSTLLLSSLVALAIINPVNAASIKDIRAQMLKASNTKAGGAYVRTRFLQLVKKPFDANDSRKKLLLIGDSHAQDFLNTVLENGYLNQYQIRTRYIPTRCQMYLGNENVSQFVDKKDSKLCAESDHLSAMKAQIAEADSVILAANWRQWSAQRLPQTIKNLRLKPSQKLAVVGRKSFGRINVRTYMRMAESDLRKLRNKVDAHQEGINQTMRQTISSKVFVDMQKTICGADNSCPVFTPDLKLLSFDGGHFTKDGAKYAGKLLFQNTVLKNF